MNSSIHITVAAKGDTVCRASGWIDVVKFFLLNFGLHAMTVVTPPGSGVLISIKFTLASLLLPFIGTTTALARIFLCTFKRDSLNTAAKAGALCMVVRSRDFREKTMTEISPALYKIQGQHPVQAISLSTWLKGCCKTNISNDYRLVSLPNGLDLYPISESHLRSQPRQDTQQPRTPSFKLPLNYNFIGGTAAIFQILYGSFGLYQERGNQIEKYGYAAYSLTVVPYILMSITNLFATICQPRYPCMFLVLYRGPKKPNSLVESTRESPEKPPSAAKGTKENPGPEIQPIGIEGAETAESAELEQLNEQVFGAVGQAYGDLSVEEGGHVSSILPKNSRYYLLLVLRVVSLYCLMVIPYIVMYLLTGLRNGQSTASQRGWILAWMVLGQAGAVITMHVLGWTHFRQEPFFHDPIASQFIQIVLMLVVSVGTIGGFVTAAKMILADQVCVVV